MFKVFLSLGTGSVEKVGNKKTAVPVVLPLGFFEPVFDIFHIGEMAKKVRIKKAGFTRFWFSRFSKDIQQSLGNLSKFTSLRDAKVHCSEVLSVGKNRS